MAKALGSPLKAFFYFFKRIYFSICPFIDNRFNLGSFVSVDFNCMVRFKAWPFFKCIFRSIMDLSII